MVMERNVTFAKKYHLVLSLTFHQVFVGATVTLCLLASGGPARALKTPDVPLAQLGSAQASERVAAARALSEEAPRDLARVLPALRDALGDPVSEVRLGVAQALQGSAMVSTENAQTLATIAPQLVERLKDTSPAVRAAAADTLAATYPYTPDRAAEGLVSLLVDSDREVREAALGALSRLRTTGPRVTRALLASLRDDPEGPVRGAAADALGTLEAGDPEVVESLIGALQDAEPFVRRQAVRALGKLGPSAYSAMDELKRIAEDVEADPELRMHAVYALRSLGVTDVAGSGS